MTITCDFESGSEIYRDGWKAIEFAKSIPETVHPEKTDIHFYWREPLPFGRKQAACIKSAIVSQNLDNVRIHLWSNSDLSRNEWVQPIERHIYLHHYDAKVEARGTPLEGWAGLDKDDELCWLGGDLFRLLILYRYGGVYVDCDVLLLRDLAPLLGQEFLYQWGTELDKMNGAVMRLFAKSKTAENLLTMIPRMPAGVKSTDWGSTLYGEVRKFDKSFTVFPCAFFNTEWQLYINMGESAHPFKKGNDSHWDFEGVFAWHWHNKWDVPIEEGSKFHRLEARINEKYAHGFDVMVDKEHRHLGGNYGGGDPGTFYPELWRHIIDTYSIKSVLDVGCGEGRAVAFFLCLGIPAVGIDGMQGNIDKCPNTCRKHDITTGSYRDIGDYDLVWCCEVVEHIEERFVDNLIKSLSNGRYVCMTFAPPGMRGYHHVNCQPAEYWISKMDAAGYQYLDRETKTMAEFGNARFKENGLFFVRRENV
jgi:2-polyprenyl-3-methyl-5-hydroxy-6-metoxy-1,4-benzoquinol methylase